MLEKPNLKDEALIACLEKEFALKHPCIEFLPLGVDRNAAVYRAESDDQTSYFVKLRSGTFNETSVTLPKYLNDMGIRPIIAPLRHPIRSAVGEPGRLYRHPVSIY